MIFGLLSLKHYFVHFAKIGRKDSELSGKYIPKKFFSCHPRFALGSRFQFGFSRRIEAVYQDSRVKLVEEEKQRPGINYFLVNDIY